MFRFLTFLLATLWLTSLPAAAQITILQSDLDALIGTTVEQDSYVAISGQETALQALINQIGPNQTWDFTGLSYEDDGVVTVEYVELPAELPAADDPRVADANYAISFFVPAGQDEFQAVLYRQATGSGNYTFGAYYTTEEGALDELYDEPLLENPFPLTYETDWTGSTAYEDIIEEIVVSVDVETEGEITGWGTLLLPGQDPVDVLRLEEVRTETQTFTGAPEPFVQQETNITFISRSFTNAAISIDPPAGGIGPTTISANYTIFSSVGGGVQSPADPPANLDPADGATDVATNPTLSWDAVEGADTYDLQVATDASFSKRSAVDVIVDETELTATSFNVSGLQESTEYFWRARGVNSGGTGPWSDTQSFATVAGTAIESRDAGLPAEFALVGTYPNPFNPATTITLDLPESVPVRVSIHDMLGRELSVLVDRQLSAGRYNVTWDAGVRPSASYLVRLQAGSFSSTRTIVLLK